MLNCRPALLERMPVFEPKTTEPITNGEVTSQPEPEPVTKEGKTLVTTLKYSPGLSLSSS